MMWSKRDPNRWHRRFAWCPRRIDDRRIWLERYAWRRIDDPNRLEPTHPLYFAQFSLCMVSAWREYTMQDGFTRWREQSGLLFFFAPPSISWHKPTRKLRVVA